MARELLGTSMLVLLVGCGGSAPPPARHADRPAVEEPQESAQTTLSALAGTCQPDSTAIEVSDTGFGTEPSLPDEEATGWRVARRTDRGVIAVACTREPFGGEVSRQIDAMEATIGGTPVILVVDIAACMATCEGEGGETERCESSVTNAWVFDRELRLIGAVSDQQGAPAAVEDGALVIGNAKRTIRDGQLVAP